MYGICVVHPRLVHARPSGMLDSDLSFDFEASVAYCFLTRFPLFDFFFKVGSMVCLFYNLIISGNLGNHVLRAYYPHAINAESHRD